jgi:hypothetical protein
MFRLRRSLTRLNRRAALRAAVPLAAGGAGLVVAGRSGAAAPTQSAAWTPLHLELDFIATPPGAVSITLAGGGPPQRGDWYYVDADIFAMGDGGGTKIGVYQCFGAWTHPSTETSAPDLRLTVVQYHLDNRGAIMGLINESPTMGAQLVGTVLGGTGEFLGATGSFRQPIIQPAADSTPQINRAILDLLLPNLG